MNNNINFMRVLILILLSTFVFNSKVFSQVSYIEINPKEFKKRVNGYLISDTINSEGYYTVDHVIIPFGDSEGYMKPLLCDGVSDTINFVRHYKHFINKGYHIDNGKLVIDKIDEDNIRVRYISLDEFYNELVDFNVIYNKIDYIRVFFGTN